MIAVLNAAMSNGQSYCASETGVPLADLFERTSDFLRATAPKWQDFLTCVFDKYDDLHRIYNELNV